MRRYATAFLASLICLRATTSFYAEAVHASQPDAQPDFRSMTFAFDRSGVLVSHWTIEVHSDGSGNYIGTQAAGVAAAGSTPSGQAVHISAGELAKVSMAYPIVRTGRCETKMKNIANTGRKTLSFQANDGTTATCTFNFSDSDPLNAAAETLLAIAETMQAGDRLAQKHRYDRLGLDAEIDSLVAEVKSGQAAGVNNIATVLQSIAKDERLMERVQRKAARLLQDADSAPGESAR